MTNPNFYLFIYKCYNFECVGGLSWDYLIDYLIVIKEF